MSLITSTIKFEVDISNIIAEKEKSGKINCFCYLKYKFKYYLTKVLTYYLNITPFNEYFLLLAASVIIQIIV